MCRTFIVCLLLLYQFPAAAQHSTDTLLSAPKSRKPVKRFYIYWGWNRAWYSDSDIRFTGTDYNFTLDNVAANDRQSEFDFETYANPATLSIPQTVLRIGYVLNKHWDISFGADHMKYVMVQNQTVNISGSIEGESNGYNGNYDNTPITLTEDFLKFEHTDGLNYLNIELRRSDELIDLNPKQAGRFTVNLTEGIGAGALLPRTNTTLMSKERYDEFHLSGYGISAVAGMNVTLWKYFFLQTEAKAGYINMPDIRTTHSKADKASQHFTFFQWNMALGVNVYF